MSLLAQISIFFLFILFGGLHTFWPVVSSQETGRGFQGLIANVILAGLILLGVVTYFSWDEIPTISYLFLLISSVGLIGFSLRARDIKVFDLLSFRLKDGDVQSDDNDKRDLLDWVLYFVSLAGFILWGFVAYPSSAYLFVLSSLLLLGITVWVMALGHYYLVVPKLSEKPLVVGNCLLWLFLIFKIGLSSWAMFESWDYFAEGSRLGDGFIMNWVFASMRILWGFLALGVLSIFSYKLAKMRSFQSATGVFYTMIFFVFVGELLSGYFYFNFGVAL